MSLSDDGIHDDPPLTAHGQLRRFFLHRTALATAGASAAASLPAAIAADERPAENQAERAGCSNEAAPMKDVAGKVAFITGGSSGIGLGIARAFIDAGMKVVIGYRTEKHLQEAMQYLDDARDRVHAIRVDVTDRPGMEGAAAETVKVFGKVHMLVNNAGVYFSRALKDTSQKDWNWLMDVNVNGVLHGTQAFLPAIQAHGEGGQIVSTASVLGLFVWGANDSAYVASKFAVVGMMESLRMELTGTNVGVSVFCPGWVSSNLMHSQRNRSGTVAAPAGHDEAQEQRLKAAVDSGYIMDPFEAGQIVLRGVRNNDLYILSHPEWEQLMKARSEALLAAVPQRTVSNEELLAEARKRTRNSIYRSARGGKSC